jgi:DNA-binding NarL/FixJ family response regulator
VALGTVFRPDAESAGQYRLCSRAEAMTDFERLLIRQNPRFRIVELSGDRWSGKTALLQDFADLAVRSGWQVGAGSATPAQAGTPLGVFGEALSEVIGTVATELRSVFPSACLSWLAAIIPGLETTVPPAQPAGRDDQYQVLQVLGRVIDLLGAAGQLVLLLDDLQWADQATLDLLLHLIRQPPQSAVIIVVAHRPRQSSYELPGAMSEATAQGIADRLSPAPLSIEAALRYLPDDFSEAQCTAILRESGRNPGLLRAMAALRLIPGESASASPALSPGVLAACMRDFRALSEVGLLAVQSASILAEPFEPDVLKAVAELDDEQVRAAIDELVEHDLIYSRGCLPRLRFVNPLLRAAAYQSAGYGWLVGARAKAAEILAGRSKPAGQIATQVAYAGLVGDEGSARLLLQAASETIWRDPAQAASWVRTATELKADAASGAGGSQLLLGRALTLAGQLSEALDVLGELPTPGAGDRAAWAEAVSCRAWARFLTGWPDQSRAELTAALKRLPHSELGALAELRQRRLIVALETGAEPAADDEASLSRHFARSSGMAAAQVAALLAMAACRHDDPLAQRYVSVASESFDHADNDDVARHLEGLYWLAQAESALGDHDAALVHCKRGLRLAQQRRIGSIVPRFAVALGTLQLTTGDLDGAARHAACALATAAVTGSDHLAGRASAIAAKVHRAKELAAAPPEPALATGLAAELVLYRSRAGMADTGGEAERAKAHSDLESLSGRELQVAILVSDGRTNEQIARRLGLSSKTVETYLARIFKKLVVSCRAEVATIVGRATT